MRSIQAPFLAWFLSWKIYSECTTLQGIIIVYFTMKNTKNLKRKSSADRITCFLPLYNPLINQLYETGREAIIYFMKLCAWDIFVSLNWTWSGEIIDLKFSIWIQIRILYLFISQLVSFDVKSVKNSTCKFVFIDQRILWYSGQFEAIEKKIKVSLQGL